MAGTLFDIGFGIFCSTIIIFLSTNIMFDIRRRSLKWVIPVIFLLALLSFLLIRTIMVFTPDDEILISYMAYLHGGNPYSVNVAQNISNIFLLNDSPVSFYTNGSIVGKMQYPIWYLYIQVPFYLLGDGRPLDMLRLVMPAEYTIFLFILYMVFFLMIRESDRKLDMKTCVLISATLSILSSHVLIVCLALMIAIFLKSARKYDWAILAAIVSLQQEFWIFAILYAVWKHGEAREGYLKWLAMFAGLAILLNLPTIYYGGIHNILLQTTSPWYPLKFLALPLQSYTLLFGALILGVAAITYYRRMTPASISILYVVPYFFLSHVLLLYFIIGVAQMLVLRDFLEGSTAESPPVQHAVDHGLIAPSEVAPGT